MSISILLDQRLSVERPRVTQDASGGASRAFDALVADVPCAIAPASSSVVSDYARRDMIVDYHIFTTANLDSLISGGLHLGDRLSVNGYFFLVKAVRKSSNSAVNTEPLFQIDCERRV